MVMFLLVTLLILGPCIAEHNTCPREYATITQASFGQTGTRAWVQQGVYHKFPCTTFQSNERLQGVVWYKGNDIDGPDRVRLVSHSADEDFPASSRYAFASEFSLVIRGVEASDEGRYLCLVIPTSAADRVSEVDVKVIANSFPAMRSETSSSTSIQRGRRQTISCQCAPQASDTPISVVYWSTGEGITTDTEIIGARLSDGTVLQIQHGADYNIASDASLTVNSINDVQDTERFWCHVFYLDGTLRNCYIDVEISDQQHTTDDALKASNTSFYLREDKQQILPCTSWTPAEQTCMIRWTKIDNTNRQIVVSYNVSTDVVSADSAFDLASDFGLVIKSVQHNHTGRYSCSSGPDTTTWEIEVHVIGHQFPLDRGSATALGTLTFQPDRKLTIDCHAASDIASTSKATVFWSFGATNAQTTTVIGTLVLPDGSKTMSDLGDNKCFCISSEGSLLINNCSQDGDVRYWCHVFPENGVLIRGYVDVVLEAAGEPKSVHVVVTVCSCLLAVVLLVMLVGLLIWKRRKRSSPVSGDKKRGGYKQVYRLESFPELHLDGLVREVKRFVVGSMGRIPITPWLKEEKKCFAPSDEVYTPLRIFLNVDTAAGTVRYKLESEFELFDDDILELSSKRVLLQGRSGCGKTTFLYRLAYDWSMGRVNSLLGTKMLVFVLPAGVLIKTGSLGKAVIQHMLPLYPNALGISIDNYCQHHPSDVAILVDGCNDSHEIEGVIQILEAQGLIECQSVITTTPTHLAQHISATYIMRSVTITGFIPDDAQMNIDNILVIFRDNVSNETEQSNDAPNETSREYRLATNTRDLKNEAINSNLHRFWDEEILRPELVCLPVNIMALCQLSIWTRGEAFHPGATMCDVFTSLVKCMFQSSDGISKSEAAHEVTHADCGCGLACNLTVKQLDVLIELGEVVLSKVPKYHEGPVALSKLELLNSSDKGKEVWDAAIKSGLVSHGKLLEPRKMSLQEVTGSRSRCLSLDDGVDSEPKVGLIRRDAKVNFALETLQQVCTGLCLAHSTETVSKWLGGVARDIGVEKTLDKLSTVIAFACLDKPSKRSEVLTFLVKSIQSEQCRIRRLSDVLQLQKLLELCLWLNLEGKCMGSLNGTLSPLFHDGRVHLIGISGHKIRLLIYLLKYAHEIEYGSILNVKSIELFRIGQDDWDELREYLDYFAQGSTTFSGKTTSETHPSMAPTKGRIHVSPGLRVVDEKSCARSEPGCEVKPPDGPQYTQYSESQTTDTKDGERNHQIRVRHPDLGYEYKRDTLSQIREKIESRDKDCPLFPSKQSDISVLHTVQSYGLQELLESQSGECHSSRAAGELARCLPGLEMLEEIVLLGTILCSEDLVDLAGNMSKLPKLKKLDLRLNRLFDDSAFEAVAKSLHYCKELTDLRLSLYRVTIDGFAKVQNEMGKNGGTSWGRLKTLYLLHGSPREQIVQFLANSPKYLQSMESYHISTSVQDNAIPGNVLDNLKQSVANPKFMPYLVQLDVGNMEELKPIISSMKLPKKRKRQMAGSEHKLRGTLDK